MNHGVQGRVVVEHPSGSTQPLAHTFSWLENLQTERII